MTNLINTDVHTTEHKVTAEEVENNCPARLQELGEYIAAHVEKMHQCEEKADQHYRSIGQYLAKAREACDEAGFEAFREKYCPNLGRTRTYELLAVGQNKISVEDLRAKNRERNARHRAKKSGDGCRVRHVTDELPELQGTSDCAGGAESEQAAEPVKPRSTVNPKDEALLGFTGRALELNRLTKGTKPERFAATHVSPDILARLGKYLSDLAALKTRSRPSETARPKVKVDLAPLDAASDLVA